MASLDYRSNPLFTFKECSSCGALHNKSCACSKGGFIGKFVRDPNKRPDSSQRPPHNCPNYLLNPFESSNDKTNVINVPQEPFVFNQDPGEDSSQSPPLIDHHCCYGCSDSLDVSTDEDNIYLIEQLLYDDTSSDDDSYEDIDYVNASPPDSELVSLEVVENVAPKDGEIDTDILLTIKDDILREKLLNVNLLIAKIEALKDNQTLSSDFITKSSSTSLNFFLEETNTFDNYLPESKTFCFNLEEISSGSPTSYLDLSLPDYEAFFCDSEPDSGNFTMDVVEDIFDNPIRELYVHVLHDLPTHPTLHLDSDFTFSNDSPRSDLVVSFPSGTRNKIFDPGIFIEDKVDNSGILVVDEEKSPHPSSHRGLRAFNESPMMISGEDTPNLDVPYLHFYPP
ncbi:hypothetical protein Tco_1136695 [Tanacetum coccineum]